MQAGISSIRGKEGKLMARAKKGVAAADTLKVQDERVFISNDDCYLFGQGTHYDIYKKLGAHESCEEFRIFPPGNCTSS